MDEKTVVEAVKVAKKGIGKKWFIIGGAILGLAAATIVATLKKTKTEEVPEEAENNPTEVASEDSSAEE